MNKGPLLRIRWRRSGVWGRILNIGRISWSLPRRRLRKLHISVEYRKSLAGPVQFCFTTWWLGGLSLGKTEYEIARFLSETKDLDIEGSKLREMKHRELFTMSYPYVEKIVASCDLPMSELLKVSPDVPLPPPQGETSSAAVEDVAQQPPTYAPKNPADTPFGTTT
nr:hypothetical protein [Tanacetum cinerariifolium]